MARLRVRRPAPDDDVPASGRAVGAAHRAHPRSDHCHERPGRRAAPPPVTAATTCLPLAYLWERGGRTVWAPALLHGLIGSWQLFERTYPLRFSLVMLVASIVVPLLALLAGDRFFARAPRPAARATPRPISALRGPSARR